MAEGETAKTHTHTTKQIRDKQLDSKTSFYWPIYRKCCSDHSKEKQTKESRERKKEKKKTNQKKNFYTFYKVSMLISPSSSSKTNVRTTLELGPMQNLPKVPRGKGRCKEGDDITRLGVTVDEENS